MNIGSLLIGNAHERSGLYKGWTKVYFLSILVLVLMIRLIGVKMQLQLIRHLY